MKKLGRVDGAQTYPFKVNFHCRVIFTSVRTNFKHVNKMEAMMMVIIIIIIIIIITAIAIIMRWPFPIKLG